MLNRKLAPCVFLEVVNSSTSSICHQREGGLALTLDPLYPSTPLIFLPLQLLQGPCVVSCVERYFQSSTTVMYISDVAWLCRKVTKVTYQPIRSSLNNIIIESVQKQN